MSLEHVFGLRDMSPARRVAIVWAVVGVFCLFVLDLWQIVPGDTWGVVPVRASAPASLALVLLGGHRLSGRSRHPVAVMSLLFGVAVTLAIVVVIYEDHAGASPASVVGMILAALDEEVVFRYALPAVMTGLFTSVGLRLGWARGLGYLVGGVAFVFMPGHVVQMDTPVHVLPFVAYAAVAALVVARSGAVVPVALVHAASNLLSLLVLTGAPAEEPRQMLAGTLMVILVFAYAVRRPGEGRRLDPHWPMVSRPHRQSGAVPPGHRLSPAAVGPLSLKGGPPAGGDRW